MICYLLSYEVHNKIYLWLLGSCEEVWQLNTKDSLETKIAWCQLGAWLKTKGDIDLWWQSGANSSHGSEQTKVAVTTPYCQGHLLSDVLVISTVGWKTHVLVAFNRYFEGWKQLVLWKVICSDGNQFGRFYMWYWSRNIGTDNVFKKYLKLSYALGKYLNTNIFSF